MILNETKNFLKIDFSSYKTRQSTVDSKSVSCLFDILKQSSISLHVINRFKTFRSRQIEERTNFNVLINFGQVFVQPQGTECFIHHSLTRIANQLYIVLLSTEFDSVIAHPWTSTQITEHNNMNASIW